MLLCFVDSYDDYEPFERPQGHAGFVMDGQPVDEYGNPTDMYPPSYGGRSHQGNGTPDDDYDFSYAGGYGYNMR